MNVLVSIFQCIFFIFGLLWFLDARKSTKYNSKIVILYGVASWLACAIFTLIQIYGG